MQFLDKKFDQLLEEYTLTRSITNVRIRKSIKKLIDKIQGLKDQFYEEYEIFDITFTRYMELNKIFFCAKNPPHNKTFQEYKIGLCSTFEQFYDELFELLNKFALFIDMKIYINDFKEALKGQFNHWIKYKLDHIVDKIGEIL
jgi:hypothetical protein